MPAPASRHDVTITGYHHVQLAMPAGEEPRAEAFYSGLIGLARIEKPPELAGRGGCWFRGEGIELHLGVEDGFRPARKAHPAFLAEGLDALERRLQDAGVETTTDVQLAGHRRFYANDPFGNRLEFLERRGAKAGADMDGMRRLAVFLVLLVLTAGMAPAHAGPRTGLPTHFGIGVAAEPDVTGLKGWMPKTGIPFDYAYQYLAAGVNTGNGWETWNEKAQFPLWYAQDAAQHGYIPVFPYYMLLQSSGSCNSCGEAERDLSNLNNGSLMTAYYHDFATLMKRLGPGTYGGVKGFGGTAVVHVEPDLSGYAEQAVLGTGGCSGHCTGKGNNPSLLRAAVKSTGVPQAAAYPNTYRGFNLALLHLRDLYAPNVLLAFHVSDWATGYDIGSQTNPVNATSLGTEAGAFAARSGVDDAPGGTSTYDLVFNDVADRDAGYYDHVLHENVWWDRTNATLPNFHRWERYVGAITARTGRPAMIWQIPLGNQHFRTENDTAGHYQDNRVEYFFHHIDELKNVGIVALLFGAGNGGSTVNFDGKGDGVTNPSSFCTHDGTSGAAICNTATSTYADDDGGYLRIHAAAYYKNPVPL